MALAIFDLDNTLIHGDSDHAWGEFLVENQLVNEALYKSKNDEFYRQYVEGTLDIFEYLEFSLAVLTQYSYQEITEWRQRFYDQVFINMMQPKAADLIAKHRAQGDYLLIITATNLFVTEPAKQLLEIDDIIAPVPEFKDNRYTGKVSGTPSFQEGKVTRLKEWLASTNHSLDDSYFYSDSHNDLPLLELVDNPIIVDGDDRLLQTAEERGWERISLRN
ncbi:HAD family hydrolase [Litoribacillus peritrichatus]|uniref:HAD family hydrolase n=1 Tax=Litoribacillus peritrichatus TaxID=718191 RepID=A0ABP7NGD7_9GAMM